MQNMSLASAVQAVGQQIKDTKIIDALGNETEIVVKKTLSKREIKQAVKNIRAKLKNGEELDDEEHELAVENGLL